MQGFLFLPYFYLRPIRGLLPKINRKPLNIKADNEYYEFLKTCQDKYIEDSNTCRALFSFHIESTVAVHHADGGPWTCGVVEETKGTDHQMWFYLNRVMKTSGLIM